MAAEDAAAPVYAVQNRLHRLKHELNLGIGVLPINAFVKGITLGGGYTYHFNDLWAWEIAQFNYSFGVDTSLKEELKNFDVQATQIKSLNYYGSTSAVVKPFYGKLAIGNRHLIHLEIYFVLGAAIGVFQNPGLVGAGFDVGGGFRFFLSQRFSLRLDVRDYTFFKADGPTSELFLGLSAAVTLGGGNK